jgi:5-methylcytosine-specific restriction protein A
VVVDHIIPHKGDKKLFWSRDNWQSLCLSCHNRKSATETGKHGVKSNERDSLNQIH